MDHKFTENIDVERCKELFAYEMTEVILMLKGEFAAVSGKNLGLSQYFGEENRMVPPKTVSCGEIPPVEMQPFGISDELADKLTVPVGTIFNKIHEYGEKSQHTAIQLGVDLPTNKPVVCPFVSPEFQVKVPEPTVIPAVPHFDADGSLVKCAPVTVAVPEGKTFGQLGQITDSYNAAKALASNRETVEQVAIPEVPTVSIPQVTCAAVSTEIPKIGIVPRPVFRPVKESAVPRAMEDLKKISDSVRLLPAKPAFAEIRQSGQPVAVPDIPHLGPLPSFAAEPVKGFSDISVPEIPDMKKLRGNSSAATK